MGIRELVLRNKVCTLEDFPQALELPAVSEPVQCPVTDVKGMIACDELAPFVYRI